MSAGSINPKRATLLAMAVFALQPVVVGGWLTLIPRVQAALELSKAELALALLAMPLALIAGLKIASPLVARLGPRRMLMIAFPLEAAVFTLIGLAWSLLSLFAALFIAGLAIGFSQIALNVYAGRLEKTCGRLIMNRCHGAWALGLMAGSLVMTLLPVIPVAAMIVVVGAPAALAGLMSARALPHLGAPPGSPPPPARKWRDMPRALIFISAFVLPVAMTEGAMGDWAAVYLSERLTGGAQMAGIGVTIYSGCLALGRFAGDALKAAIGVVTLARLTVGLAMAGIFLLVLPLPTVFAFAGFGLAGLGVSVGFPLGISAVSALDETHEAPNVAIMSMASIAAVLIGPPIIGLIAEATSLRLGLAVLLPGLAISLVLASWLNPAGRDGQPESHKNRPDAG